MGPCDLAEVMKKLIIPESEKVLVGFGTSDDAGVFLLTDDTALIQTIDFITPVIDDPYIFGKIAATNSLSDVYAMGGTALTALNIVCFPSDIFGLDILRAILEGGLDVCREAECQLLGGHSIKDKELKYGMSVTGLIHPKKVIRNRGLLDGDTIILTKPLGTGIIATAVKAGMITDNILLPYIQSMTRLNKEASRAIQRFQVHACTDVTGFGLAGHLKEMMGNDTLEVRINKDTLPILPGAIEFAQMGLIPGGRYRNEDYVASIYNPTQSLPKEITDIIFDPQTSGGLIFALHNRDALELLKILHDTGDEHAAIIGEVFHIASSSKISIF